MIYIIAYDITDNKRRLRVAKTLESWGYRILNPCSSSALIASRWGACARL